MYGYPAGRTVSQTGRLGSRGRRPWPRSSQRHGAASEWPPSARAAATPPPAAMYEDDFKEPSTSRRRASREMTPSSTSTRQRKGFLGRFFKKAWEKMKRPESERPKEEPWDYLEGFECCSYNLITILRLN
ncbi:uncharacterized protein LOC126267628 [Schistocerca gregaria]|uniref:uncharacterized protein LOC126267628 n=1 Tax=Schistocerca gregaria TaxID=7010 RepID=UPI00211EB4BC|nr:uncharacterized protein LOC126267628 [Schistocerca gregaria]